MNKAAENTTNEDEATQVKEPEGGAERAEERKRQAEKERKENELVLESSSESGEILDPEITSDDPVKRKLARRLRIQRRCNAVQKTQKMEKEEEKEIGPQTLVEQQIYHSMSNIQQLFTDGQEQVSNVRIASDAREVKRRNEQREARRKRSNIVEEEAEESLDMFIKINEKWTEIARSNDPLDIYDEMEKQKLKCLELIKRKNEIIEELTAELHVNDEQFDRDQKKQREDLHVLAERIDDHINLMKRAYRQELHLMEEAIHMEQKDLLEAANQEWEDLYEGRGKEEKLAMRKKFDLITELEGEMDNLHIEHNEKIRETKIRLERDIHVLEHELERIRALCMLNTEKLDYNVQILKKRDDENLIMKAHQKRHINKLQDLVNDLRKEIKEAEETTKTETQRLSDEVLKFHQSILEVENKADHFSKVNDKKYDEVWEMNKQVAHDHLDKVYNSDKIIHEQQLGLEWKKLEMQEMDKTELPSYRSAMQVVSELFKEEEPEKESECSSQSSDVDEMKIINSQEALLRLILNRVADEFGFLLEDEVITLLFPFRKAEKTLIRIDNVFTALGIKTEADVLMMREYFIPYTKCNICGLAPSAQGEVSEKETASEEEMPSSKELYGESEEEETYLELPHHGSARPGVVLPVGMMSDTDIDVESHRPQSVISELEAKKKKTDSTWSLDQMPLAISAVCKDAETEEEEQLPRTYCSHLAHPLKIDPVFVTKALRDFIIDFSKRKERLVKNVSARLVKRRRTVSRLLNESDVTEYWERYREAFPQERERIWNGLIFGLSKYHEILIKRNKINTEIRALKKENEELRRLLQNYVTSFVSNCCIVESDTVNSWLSTEMDDMGIADSENCR